MGRRSAERSVPFCPASPCTRARRSASSTSGAARGAAGHPLEHRPGLEQTLSLLERPFQQPGDLEGQRRGVGREPPLEVRSLRVSSAAVYRSASARSRMTSAAPGIRTSGSSPKVSTRP